MNLQKLSYEVRISQDDKNIYARIKQIIPIFKIGMIYLYFYKYKQKILKS
ncbi:hypothetical protein B11515_09320 [Campylobacter jejuni]|nr:hypothetical protein B11515_09320 [Campylobacter jejuni]